MVTMNLQHHDIPQIVLIHLRLEFLLLLNLAFFFLNRICICIYRRLGGRGSERRLGGGGLKMSSCSGGDYIMLLMKIAVLLKVSF